MSLYISLDQEVQIPVYDDNEEIWYTHTDTIGNILKTFTDYRHLKVIDLNDNKWGSYEEKKKD